MTTTRTVEDDARDALVPGVWMTASQVHHRAACWSQISMRHALRDMAARGEIETRLVQFRENFTREYRR